VELRLLQRGPAIFWGEKVVENQQETPKNHGMFGNFVGVKHGLTVRI
jgi:hypothetical protein